jgi:hypothetical protein
MSTGSVSMAWSSQLSRGICEGNSGMFELWSEVQFD